MIKNTIPPGGIYVLDKLNKAGYQAYLVGGSVRDMVRGQEAKDYDITTSARPDEIIDLFKDLHTVQIGKKYGTIGVIYEGQIYEVTTYRKDGLYEDGRRPKSVSFSHSLEEDLARRDFTINAMAMDKDLQIIDPFGGRKDLEAGIVRTVGPAEVRFEEDKLRLLRAIRFASILDFQIEEKTYKAILAKAQDIDQVSKERIQEELNKMLVSKTPSRSMDLLEETRLLDAIIPELRPTVGYDQCSPYHHRSLFKHITCVMDRTRPRVHLRLAALFHDIAKPDTLSIDEDGVGHFYGHEDLGAQMAVDILRRLKYPKKTIHKVESLIKNHMSADPNMKRKGIKRLIKRVGEDLIYDLIDFMIADTLCTKEGRDISFLENMKDEVRDILESEEVVDSKGLVINGKDLLALGYDQGPALGQVLEDLTSMVIDGQVPNDYHKLMKIAEDKLEDK